VPDYRPGLGDDCGRYLRRRHGYLEWRRAPGDTVEVVNVEVEGPHRGRGEGSDMLRELERLPGVAAVYGFAAAGNARALAFYAKNGYSLVPVPGFYGRGRDAVLFLKVIR
jgi:GNAT superfamily N-acetyltransferase